MNFNKEWKGYIVILAWILISIFDIFILDRPVSAFLTNYIMIGLVAGIMAAFRVTDEGLKVQGKIMLATFCLWPLIVTGTFQEKILPWIRN